MADEEDITRFHAPGITLEAADKVVGKVWAELQKEPSFAKARPELLNKQNPYVLSRPGGQFGVAETIIVAVAGNLLKDSMEGVWKSYVWPALKRELGIPEK